jgi:Putative bacterial sensory transduction regulator
MRATPLTTLTCLVLLLSPVAGWAQADKDKVYRKVPAKLLEGILDDLNIRFKKTASSAAGSFMYEYERNSYKIRLTNFGGRTLMLDAGFAVVALDKINEWNVRARFCRGVVYPGGGKPYTSLENDLDCEGGVTAGTLKQFIRSFDKQVKAFALFVGAGGPGPAVGGPAVGTSQLETVYRTVSSELVEKVLKGLDIASKKITLNDGASFAYEFDRNNFRIRLLNFGSRDLMLTSEFRKATLEEANNYNLRRKFIRAVVYRDGGREYTALEANLDGEGGVTENMLRNFITTYTLDVRDFDKFLSK